jgi:hypothetical protein
MSLIHSPQLRAANALDNLVVQQRLARNLPARPQEWVPCNYPETIKRAQA